MRRPLAAVAALRLRLRFLSPAPSPCRLLSASHLLLSRRDDDNGREGPTSSPPPPPPPSPFSPRLLLTSASGAAGLLGLRGGWRGLPPAASRPPGAGAVADAPPVRLTISRSYSLRVAKGKKKAHFDDEHSHRAVNMALWCNFLVFSLKFGVWISTSSHVMLAELVHSVADFANQALLAYGLSSSRRAPDAIHPYGYSKERFVWSLISAVGIFCLGSGATIVHGVQNLWNSQPLENIHYAALVIGGSFLIEGASLLVAIKAVKKGAEAEGMNIWDYIWRGHDPTSVAVMTEDGAAVTGLAIAAASLVAVQMTGNAIYDPIGSIIVGNILGMVAIFLIQRNRHALIGRAIDDHDMQQVLEFLKSDPVVDALYDCKSEVIGPGFFRFKAEIDFNGVVLVQNYLERTGRGTWAKQFREAAISKDDTQLLRVMANYGEDVVEALGYEVDRLESEIQKLVPGIKHVDIEAHNPEGLSL
ncbi:metal tolerance protein C4-like isoform X1 [Phragmites australis]|uniref:metal tolerance protein C4-like isoform X1 n=1 Tax=Phragmites australis TaxID=29695 RepID=UPI002D7763F9|nr:metal tolerance protein C4-like isoform X1 [Phragmites australis]XP_062184531.1 metal tolerance protein C4-like isoform X1 [Phragmites australis]